jgi:hypothetical protein
MIGAVAMTGGAAVVATAIKLSVHGIKDRVNRDIGTAGMAAQALQLGAVHVILGWHSARHTQHCEG